MKVYYISSIFLVYKKREIIKEKEQKSAWKHIMERNMMKLENQTWDPPLQFARDKFKWGVKIITKNRVKSILPP